MNKLIANGQSMVWQFRLAYRPDKPIELVERRETFFDNYHVSVEGPGHDRRFKLVTLYSSCDE